ncbi:MAG: hypothetical protein ACRDI2_07285 [Chloroflexota bacterium]
MVAEQNAPSVPSASPGGPSAGRPPGVPAYAPPNPQAEAQRLLNDGRDLLDQALKVLRGGGSPSQASELVGRASDRAGSALHFMRQLQRR